MEPEEDILARYERLGFERRRRLHRREVVGRFAAFIGRPADGQQQLQQLQRRAAESSAKVITMPATPVRTAPTRGVIDFERAAELQRQQAPADWRDRW
jgi:regulator of protease activity HflC (stomatin/prohibitin superfamily)